MKRIKQICALLMAVVITFTMAFHSGISVLYAEDLDTGSSSEPADTYSIIEYVTEPPAETVTEPSADASEPAVTDVSDPAVDPAVTTDVPDSPDVTDSTDVSDVPAGDEGDLPAYTIFEQLMSCSTLGEMEALLFAQENAPAVAMLTAEERSLIISKIDGFYSMIPVPSEGDIALRDRLVAILAEPIAEVCPDCGGLDGEHAEDCPANLPECTCGSEDGVHAEDCPLYVPDDTECTCGSEDGVHAEDCPANLPECTCGSEDGIHAQDCPLYVPDDTECTCGSEDGVHAEDCPANLPECTCGSEDGIHAQDCPLYVPDDTECTCGSEDGVHAEDCPANLPECTCGSEDGVHAEDCPLYEAVYPWSGLTDTELCAWLMDEANAEAVKAILADNTTEEYALLTLRLEAIMDSEDTELAEQVMAYLTMLIEMDETETLEADKYIYFDLAAGNVTIGEEVNGVKTYSGSVYVNGEIKPVFGEHKTENKYYIYQSTEANRGTTGYVDETAYTNRAGCIVPTYNRVLYNGQPWTEYITNNINVEAVINNWEDAAKAVGRTALGEQATEIKSLSTGNHITFKASQNYTADVTIDNIWTYYQDYGNDRDVGALQLTLKKKEI